MITKDHNKFCQLLDNWRHENLFCDAYLVGDDDIMVPLHKAILASKAYLLLNYVNKEDQHMPLLFDGELLKSNQAENYIFKIDGYDHHIIDTFISMIYMQDFEVLNIKDLMLQLCFFLYKIAKFLNMSDDYILQVFVKFQDNTSVNNSVNSSFNSRNKPLFLEKRWTDSSDGESVFVCQHCKKDFVSRSILDYHVKSFTIFKSQSGKILIKTCQGLYLEQALQIIDNCKEVFCDRGKVTTFEETPCEGQNIDGCIPTKHESRYVGYVHSAGLLCLKCNKKFTTYGNLRRHQTTVHMGIKKFSCPLCVNKFGQKVTLRLHLATVHNIVPASATLGENNSDGTKLKNAISPSKKSVQMEVSSVFNSDVDVPPTAKKVMSVNGGATLEILSIDKNTWQKKTTCEVCNKQFSRPSNLRKHLLIHNAINTIDDDLNGICTNFHQNSSLRKSYDKLHANRGKYKIGNFICDLCGKKFMLAEYLKKHISVVHCSVKKFSCCNCSKKFASRTRLKRHEAVHERMKCDRCSKVLVGQRAFKNHMRNYCEISSFPLQEDSQFFFNDTTIANITLKMLAQHTVTP